MRVRDIKVQSYVVIIGLVLSYAALSYAQDCIIEVPAHALSAKGLATPYVILNPDVCTQADPNLTSFVEATIVDLDTGALSVYSPLVIDKGTVPAIAPVVPTLPARNVVGLWFGTNGNTLTLVGATATALSAAGCVNGLPNSIFGQFAYCNGPQFFTAANALITAKKLVIPPLGTTILGEACFTTRYFGVVDQDQSDNVVSTYLLTQNKQLAQNTAANRAALANSTVVTNGSDNALLNSFILPAVHCKPFAVNDLADPGVLRPSLATDELHAALANIGEQALVPANDPMVLLANGSESLSKVNLYRVGVNQPQATSIAQGASPLAYCQNIRKFQPQILTKYNPQLAAFTTPAADVGNNLLNFLGARFVASYQNLGCQALLNLPCPVILTLDGNGVAIGLTIKD